MLAFVSKRYSEPKGRFPRVTHPCATVPEGTVRLACVRHAASVRSEPGSNSQVQIASNRSRKRLRRIAVSVPKPKRRITCYSSSHSCIQDALQTSAIVPIPNNQGPNTLASNGSQVPPPAHPFSQHGINLSMIPQRRKRRIGHSPIPLIQRGGPEKAENVVAKSVAQTPRS